MRLLSVFLRLFQSGNLMRASFVACGVFSSSNLAIEGAPP